MTRECKGYERMWDGASKCEKGLLYMMVWLRKIYSPSDIELTPLAQYEIGTKYTLQVHASAANGEANGGQREEGVESELDSIMAQVALLEEQGRMVEASSLMASALARAGQ